MQFKCGLSVMALVYINGILKSFRLPVTLERLSCCKFSKGLAGRKLLRLTKL